MVEVQDWSVKKLSVFLLVVTQLPIPVCAYFRPSASRFADQTDRTQSVFGANDGRGFGLLEILWPKGNELLSPDLKRSEALQPGSQEQELLASLLLPTDSNFSGGEALITALVKKMADKTKRDANTNNFLDAAMEKGEESLDGKEALPSVSKDVGRGASAAASSDVNTRIDDVMSLAFKSNSKRGIQDVQRAQPPTNELCRLMKVRCYG